ncbi:hypothetical protein C823_003008 [Eubacterium plexicaudatum ASF492]|nr:hypothetical protein C823_003008 [Eubacterium plexicaudatum ASF492]
MNIFTDHTIKKLFYEILLSVLIFTVFSAVSLSYENAAPLIFTAALCMAGAIVLFCYVFFADSRPYWNVPLPKSSNAAEQIRPHGLHATMKAV